MKRDIRYKKLVLSFLNAPLILGVSILISGYLSLKSGIFYAGKYGQIFPGKYGEIFLHVLYFGSGISLCIFGVVNGIRKIRKGE